jgi:hypothetical protein
MHGQGKTVWPDGTIYEGGYVDDKRHGKGETAFPDGKKFLGQYKNGEKNGFGIETATSGEVSYH